MERNSIRDNLSKDDIISDITLCMGEDIYRKNVYVIVEGNDDIKFFRQVLSDNVLLYESYDGKNGVKIIVDDYFGTKANVIGIRDRDYQSNPICDKIFYYDNCCMEMMMLGNAVVFDKLYFEYYRGPLLSKDLKMLILAELKYLSIFRMLNERLAWGISFKGISIANAWDKTNKRINNDILLKKIDSINCGRINDDLKELIESEYMNPWEECDLLKYTQGHDFTMLYAAECGTYMKKGVGYREIETSLRCSYRIEDFLATELYHNVKLYEQKNDLRIWIPVA